jgi:hypothetical protein
MRRLRRPGRRRSLLMGDWNKRAGGWGVGGGGVVGIGN